MPWLNFNNMKIVIKGNEKKVNQLYKELVPRIKRDNLEIEISGEKIVKDDITEEVEVKPVKRGRKAK